MSHDKNVHDKKMHDKKSYDKKENENIIEGRNAVMEAFRSGKPVDKLYVLDGCQDGAVRSIIREARKHDTILNFVEKDRLNQLSETGKHQGVIASVAAYEYAEVEDMLKLAEEKGEDPFLIILDNIEDPHNLGAIIRTANQAGAHGVIIPKRRAVGLTATVARTSAGALNYTPVAKVTNLVKTMEDLKKKYTVVVVTHNMQQATRVSDETAFFLVGEVVEFDKTETIFSNPKNKKTEDYITGRFG